MANLTITIKVNTDNDAFIDEHGDDYGNLAELLEDSVHKVLRSFPYTNDWVDYSFSLIDPNGNTVGELVVDIDDKPKKESR